MNACKNSFFVSRLGRAPMLRWQISFGYNFLNLTIGEVVPSDEKGCQHADDPCAGSNKKSNIFHFILEYMTPIM